MKIKLINYNKTISHIGMNRVLIDEVKVVKPEDGDGPEILEVLFVNETGTIKREFDLKKEIEAIISMVNACGIEIPEDFDFDPDLLLGRVLNIELVRDFGFSPHVERFSTLNAQIAADEKVDNIVNPNNPFEDDD